MRRALVIGASGFIGKRLTAQLGPRGVSTFRSVPVAGGIRFDAATERLKDLLPRLPGDLSHVFVPFGKIDVEACARDPAGTAAINIVAVLAVLKDAIDAGLIPIFFSTDYVFDGARGSYTEDECCHPNTSYGAQKLAVESWLGATTQPWLTARLSKVVGADPDTHSVLGQWALEIKAGKKQVLAVDQIFSPTWVDDACGALIKLAESGETGLFHVANPEPFSRLSLFQLLLDGMRARSPHLSTEIETRRLHELPYFSERRPLNTSLRIDKFAGAIGWRFKPMSALCAEAAEMHA